MAKYRISKRKKYWLPIKKDLLGINDIDSEKLIKEQQLEASNPKSSNHNRFKYAKTNISLLTAQRENPESYSRSVQIPIYVATHESLCSGMFQLSRSPNTKSALGKINNHGRFKVIHIYILSPVPPITWKTVIFTMINCRGRKQYLNRRAIPKRLNQSVRVLEIIISDQG